LLVEQQQILRSYPPQDDMAFSLGMTAGFPLRTTAGTIKKLPRMLVPVEKIVIATV
jgi:hypothetical protein